MSNIITLTTDFGLQDHYVATLKAVILSRFPDTCLVDISHEIPPQDVMAGAWVLKNAIPWFPDGTVHLVVVDPGVGTSRNPVALKIDNQYFVGPDNGIFSLIADDKEVLAYRLTESSYWNQPLSKTFHGRDLFAPVAAQLANGTPLEELGTRLDKLETYHWATPISDKDGIQGWIVHIDRFGNLISNIPDEMIQQLTGDRRVRIYVGNTILDELCDSYGFVEEGEPVACVGSSGMLEVAINKGDAASMLSVRKGAQISIVLQK